MRRTTAILLGLFLILLVSCENPFASKSSKDKEDSTEQVLDDSADQAQDENNTSDSTDASSDQSSDDSNTQDDSPVVVTPSVSFSDYADSYWCHYGSGVYWEIEFTDSEIKYDYEDDAYEVDATIPMPADGDLTVTMDTTADMDFTASFPDENTMILKDPSDVSFTFHRVQSAPVELKNSLWITDGVGFFGCNHYSRTRIDFHDALYTANIYGVIIGIDGNTLNVMERSGDVKSFSYSCSGSTVTVEYLENSYTMEYVEGFPDKLAGTAWSATHEGEVYTVDFVGSNRLGWICEDPGSSVCESWYNYNDGVTYPIILQCAGITISGISYDDADITLDLSDTSAGIPCSYNGSVVMTLGFNPDFELVE